MRAVVVPSVMSTPDIAAELARSTLAAVTKSAVGRLLSAQGVEALGQRRPRRPGEVDPRPARGHGEADDVVGGRRDVRGRSTFRGDERPQVADRRLHAGADVDDEPAAPLAGPHEGVDDVVDVDEVAGLATVAGDPGDARAGARRPTIAATTPASDRWRGPYTVAGASAVNSMPHPLPVRASAGRRSPWRRRRARRAAASDPSFTGSSRPDGWPYRAVAGSVTTTFVTPDRRAASSTPSIDVNDRPSATAEPLLRGSSARW